MKRRLDNLAVLLHNFERKVFRNMEISMNLIRSSALAVAASLLLPAMASAETDCASYMPGGGGMLSLDAFDSCLAAGAWNTDDEFERASLMFAAAKNGADITVFERMIDENFSVPDYGLMGAVRGANLKLIDWFVDQGANADGFGMVKEPPLDQAQDLHHEDPEKAKHVMAKLLENGADPNQFFDYGGAAMSPMHRATMANPEIVDLLLSHGGDINLRLPAGSSNSGIEGATPLHYALAVGADANMAEHLLAKGADPLAPMAGGLRPVDMDADPGADVNSGALAAVRVAAGMGAGLEAKDVSWYRAYCQAELPDSNRRALEKDPIGVDGFCECAAQEAAILAQIRIDRGLVAPNAEAYDRLHRDAVSNGAAICGIRYGD